MSRRVPSAVLDVRLTRDLARGPCPDDRDEVRSPVSRSSPARAAAAAAALALAAVLMAGCGHPPAVLSTKVIAPDEPAEWHELTPPGQWRELTPAERSAALEAMHALAAGAAPKDPPAPAPGKRKVRWLDVEPAAEAALAEIEATYTAKHFDPGNDTWRFDIVTVEASPGELIVRRVDGEGIYEARAWIGRFPDRPEHRERAEKLLAAFDEQMKKLGAIPWFNDEDAG